MTCAVLLYAVLCLAQVACVGKQVRVEGLVQQGPTAGSEMPLVLILPWTSRSYRVILVTLWQPNNTA